MVHLSSLWHECRDEGSTCSFRFPLTHSVQLPSWRMPHANMNFLIVYKFSGEKKGKSCYGFPCSSIFTLPRLIFTIFFGPSLCCLFSAHTSSELNKEASHRFRWCVWTWFKIRCFLESLFVSNYNLNSVNIHPLILIYMKKTLFYLKW